MSMYKSICLLSLEPSESNRSDVVMASIMVVHCRYIQ